MPEPTPPTPPNTANPTRAGAVAAPASNGAPAAGTPAPSAVDGPVTAGVRRVITRTQSLGAAQAVGSRAIQEAFDRATSAANLAHDEAVQSAQQRETAELASAAADYDEALRALEAKITGERRAADASLSGELADLQDRAKRDLNRAAKARSDALWLADSVYDTKRPKPGQEFEATRRELEDRAKNAGVLRAAADDFLGRCRCPKLPAPAAAPPAPIPTAAQTPPAQAPAPAPAGVPSDAPIAPTPEAPALSDAPPAPATDAGARERTRAHVDQAQQHLASLRALILPRLMQELAPLVILLLFVGSGVAASIVLLKEREPWKVAALGGLLGAVGLVFLMAILAQARRRTRVIAEAMARSLDLLERDRELALAHAQAVRDQTLSWLRGQRDGEVARATAAYADVDQQVRTLLAAQTQGYRAKHTERVAKLADVDRAGRAQAIKARDFRLSQARREAADAHKHALATHATETARARAQFDHDWHEMQTAWHSGMAEALAEARALHAVLERQPDRYPAPGDLRLPARADSAVRIGRVKFDLRSVPGALPADERLATGAPPMLDLPVALELPARASLFIQHPPAPPGARSEAIALLNAAVLRLLSVHPPGKVRLTLIDPVGLGQSFAGLMHLADYFPALVNERIWSETKHIEQRLIDLTEHMETVIQKFLRNQFADIAQYNEQAGEVAEPYRFLVIADFPAGLSEQAAARLAAIISSGPRCGVYTLIAANIRERLPAGPLSMKDIERASLTLAHRQGRWTWVDHDLAPWPLDLDRPPPDDEANALIHAIGVQSKDSGRVQVSFDVVAPPRAERWTGDTTREVRAPLGRAGALKIQHLALGRGTAQHTLIAGRTGSGKSTLLHVVITSLAMWYSPDEVELYLVDFKKGVEFKPYAEHRMPHARVIAIESEREFGLSVLRRLDEELQRRGELFRKAGAQDLAGYRGAAKAPESGLPMPMPRILLIIDEFQELFAEDDKIAGEAALLLDRLVRQGRAFGMHVILGSQTLAGSYSLPRSTIGQMAVRIALQCSEADSYLILSDDNPAARLLARPGEAIYNDASGMLEGNSPFQVAWLEDDRRSQLLGELAELSAQSARLRERTPAIVFEGSRPAELPASEPLNALLARPPASAPAVARLWLGDPVAIKEPTHAALARQSASNVLIVGQRDEAAIGMMAGSLVSLVRQHVHVPGARVLLMDGTPADGQHHGVLPALAAALGPRCDVVDYRQVGPAISAIAAEVRAREGATASEQPPPIFILIHALHRFRQLRKQDDDWGTGMSSSSTDDDAAAPAPARPDKDLVEILDKGPPLGVHVVAWCDTVNNLERTLPRASQREFDTRVLLQVSAADSSALIDSPMASTLGPYRAVLFSESQGVTERFRPYAPPSAAWVERVRDAVGR